MFQMSFGPLFLTDKTIKCEMKFGLGGFIYVQCGNGLFIKHIRGYTQNETIERVAEFLHKHRDWNR